MIKSNKQKNITQKKLPSHNEPTNVDRFIAEIMPQNLKGSKGFILIFVVLLVAILWTGVVTALNIHEYRKNYGQLQDIKSQYMKLEIDYRRLLIAQQTFSTTQKIASRARSELNMHFPTFQHKMVLQPTHLPDSDKQMPTTKNSTASIVDQEVSE